MKTFIKRTTNGDILIHEISTFDMLLNMSPLRMNMFCMLTQRTIRNESPFLTEHFHLEQWDYMTTGKLLHVMYPDVFVKNVAGSIMMDANWFTENGRVNFLNPFTKKFAAGYRYPMLESIFKQYGNRTVRLTFTPNHQIQIEQV